MEGVNRAVRNGVIVRLTAIAAYLEASSTFFGLPTVFPGTHEASYCTKS